MKDMINVIINVIIAVGLPLTILAIVIFFLTLSNIFSNKPTLLYFISFVSTVFILIAILIIHRYRSKIKLPYSVNIKNSRVYLHKNF